MNTLCKGRLNIEEIDGSPSVFPYKLKVTNGSLTDNGDGTATLDVTTGGITDHGALSGLADDDHTQYLLNTGDIGTGNYSFDGAVTINNSQADKDFRIGAVGAPNALFVDGTNGNVGINDYDNSPPLAQLHLKSRLSTMQIFEQTADGVMYGFGSQGGYFRIKYFGSLLGGSDSEFMRMGINVDINHGKKNIDFKYSGDTTANIFVLDAGLEEVKTLDNVPYTMGTGGDSKDYYDGTNRIIDPNVVGSGKVLIGATGDDTINAGAYEVAGVAGVNFSGAVTNITVVNGIVTAAS